jgi:hypothetical protein
MWWHNIRNWQATTGSIHGLLGNNTFLRLQRVNGTAIMHQMMRGGLLNWVIYIKSLSKTQVECLLH